MKTDEHRYRVEREFHDQWAREVDVNRLDPERMFRCPAIPESRYSIECLGDLRGKRVLDLGCGYGETSIYLALQGAQVAAVDLSPEMIRRTEELARKYRVEGSVTTSVQNAEGLSFEDECFDVVYGQDVLHHTRLDKSIPEIHRVLRKGGKGCFSEPLGHNWIINFFRRISPEIRTEDEHPLILRDIRSFRKWFRNVQHKEFHLTTLVLFLWFQVLDFFHKKRDGRPWKQLIEESDRYLLPIKIFFALDRCLFTVIPFLKRYCRMMVISFEK